ncbi:adenylate kinase isoenzyme 1 [Talpa occidentalis]|uniref:adenylate kinase isoenzyme 1 n=1 Tax=Talpa occidentalis TaxID=50954 RepID=UPI00189013E3|nr:adenylate kinase isoenzyme 1 [Talpa occidentalis]XP_037361102.1 adenylate kinase isoenzyme 1 [Talpa occidentalis]XP_037361103.1 adenylate kinase isoenzyme 1 [Talpa occidentalis]XP_054549053.1 adenylate kinase isoenzyme 1 [Talpa occidentalis]XP_054549054.1 adenylate kinase isoenzyme 1 [Talpa occidentalis]
MGLGESKLPQKGRSLRPQEKDILKSPLIIFVMGGPGCGKGTQCKNMATKYGFCHVGLGQLLRQEAQQGTRRGQKIRDIMLQGLLVPTGIILDMISDNMLSYPESPGFLIDGFPRELRQAKEFERIVGRAPNIVMVFDCSMETMVQRVLRRGQVEHRADDCESAIHRRLETHYTLFEPVLTFYQQKNLLWNILAEETPQNIFAKCCSVIDSLQ